MINYFAKLFGGDYYPKLLTLSIYFELVSKPFFDLILKQSSTTKLIEKIRIPYYYFLKISKRNVKLETNSLQVNKNVKAYTKFKEKRNIYQSVELERGLQIKP